MIDVDSGAGEEVALDAGANPPTPREVEVLRPAADGTPPRGRSPSGWCLTVATVRNHLSAIIRKAREERRCRHGRSSRLLPVSGRRGSGR